MEEEQHPDRPTSLMAEIVKDSKETLVQPPINQRYRQFRWDCPLVRKYLRERSCRYRTQSID
jgi:hypothetical protein